MLIKYKFLLVIYLAKTWTLVLQSNKSCYSNDNSKHKCFNPTTNTNKMDTSFTEDKACQQCQVRRILLLSRRAFKHVWNTFASREVIAAVSFVRRWTGSSVTLDTPRNIFCCSLVRIALHERGHGYAGREWVSRHFDEN